MPNLKVKKINILWIVIVGIFAVYRISYINKVLPNIYFAGENLSGKNGEEVESLVENKFKNFGSKNLTVESGNTRFEITWQDLGVYFEQKNTVEKITGYGRDNLLKDNLLDSLIAPFKKTYITPIYYIDYPKFSKSIELTFKPLEQQTANAKIIYKNGNFDLEEGENGSIVDRSKFIDRLKYKIENLSSETIVIDLLEDEPLIKSNQAKKALERVSLLNKQRIILKYDQDTWSLTGNALVDILKFAPKGQEDGFLVRFEIFKNPVVITKIYLREMPQPQLAVSLDDRKLESFIEDIASSIDRPTVDASLEFSGGRVVKFTAARDGQKLDVEETRHLILDKVSVDNLNVEKDLIIKLPVAITPAKIANEEVNSLGIRELVGRGVSYFAGSIPNRIFNVKLGAQRINGAIVKPGEVFSFNQIAGEVSAATGYKQAYVISAGRTVLDDGGGICQVSTTVFRAALNAGLPIMERTAHAYRVGYYEQRGFTPGLDATVWAPAVDLKFRNDTDKHLLVQTVVDPVNYKLEVDFYGTKDNRKVEITTPIVSNIKPPPMDLYQDDPSLPKGTTKQVDFAAYGATAIFSRKVYKQDKLIIDESFKSNFRPWQAIFLVGTGG